MPGYEGLYEVSSLGRVKSLERIIDGIGRGFPRVKKESILTPGVAGNGYLFVNLSKDGLAKEYFVHRLVALAFIPNQDNKGDVNHKDGNKRNNIVDNLEWCTRKENVQHAYRLGLIPLHRNQPNKKQVEISDGMGFVKVFRCIADAASFIGVSQSGVSRACSGKIKHSGGYVCRFLND